MQRSPIELLISRMIGIARATDGNEHLIGPDVTSAILDGLCLSLNGADKEQAVRAHYAALLEIKRRMIPDCFLCAAPCGKNNDLEISELAEEDAKVRSLKLLLLETAQLLAGKVREGKIELTPRVERWVYRCLIAYGMTGISEDQLQEILDEMS